MTRSPASVMDALRAATRERHARMEALPFVAALSRGTLPLESYVGQLRAMAVIHGSLEYELHRARLAGVQAMYQARPSRLAHLRADLGAFDRLVIPDCLEALEQARAITERIRLYRMEEPEALLGILYVLEGTTLGNAVHLPDAVRAVGDRVPGGTRYYAGYGDWTDDYWQEFRATIDAIPMDQAGAERLIAVSHALFDRLEALVGALYPVRETGWGFTASMLNPEAGQHAVPDTREEIQAAVAAARRCREAFPYFDSRYRERGEAFAKSDAAWLATLVALSPVECLSQVEWLGRVLGNRGMPRITLERQLALLHEELAKARPAHGVRYAGLRDAAEHLTAERLRRIPEARFAELARGFSDATDGEMRGRYRNTGALIVSAVCDEAAGITEAVGSLTAWLTEPERFPVPWISAVTRTVELARTTLTSA